MEIIAQSGPFKMQSDLERFSPAFKNYAIWLCFYFEVLAGNTTVEAGLGNFRSHLIFERTCLANQAGENSSFIFTVCVKSVPRYHFKLAYVILQMAVKKFFRTDF